MSLDGTIRQAREKYTQFANLLLFAAAFRGIMPARTKYH